MNGANAVNISRHIRNREIARIDHAEIDVQRLPKLFRAIRPASSPLSGSYVQSSRTSIVLISSRPYSCGPRTAGLNQGSKTTPRRAEEIAHPIPPAELFLVRTGSHKIHRPRQINACAPQEMMSAHTPIIAKTNPRCQLARAGVTKSSRAATSRSESSRMIKAVIFDLDGTLVDSNELHVQSWDETFRHFGKRFPLDALRKEIGKGGDQYLPVFLRRRRAAHTAERKSKNFDRGFSKKNICPRSKVFRKCVSCSSESGVTGKGIALATSGGSEEMDIYEKLTGIENLVDEKISGDDAQKTKPCPDIFEAALRE